MEIGQEIYVVKTVGNDKYTVLCGKIVSFDTDIACIANLSGTVDFFPVEGLLETDEKLAAVVKQLKEQGRMKV